MLSNKKLNVKTLLFLLPVIIHGCSKSGSNNVTPKSSFTGKYTLFRISDTSFSSTYPNVTVKTLTGDTAYLNIGSATHYIVQPNPIADFNPKYGVADTLNFQTPAGGTETDAYSSYPFTYSFSTDLFNDGSITDPAQSVTILRLSDTEIETIFRSKNGTAVVESSGAFFRKL